MKEAIGGSWLFIFVIVFLALFSGFIALSTNYSKCYKTKDQIIAIITNHRGVSKETIAEINDTIANTGYRSTGKCPQDGNCYVGFAITNDKGQVDYASATNYCISKTNVTDNEIKDNKYNVYSGVEGHPSFSYYRVAVFFGLDIPVFHNSFNVTITGETQPFYVLRSKEFEFMDKCNNKG